MRVTPHLSFNGQCEAAFRFYETCLGGRISFLLTYGDSPMASQFPPEFAKKIIHATFTLGDYTLTGADAMPGTYQTPQGFTIMLNPEDAEAAERIFAAFADQGSIQLPLQETFWAKCFGMVTDQFGIPWQINCAPPA